MKNFTATLNLSNPFHLINRIVYNCFIDSHQSIHPYKNKSNPILTKINIYLSKYSLYLTSSPPCFSHTTNHPAPLLKTSTPRISQSGGLFKSANIHTPQIVVHSYLHMRFI
jgi:hypothetical protein